MEYTSKVTIKKITFSANTNHLLDDSNFIKEDKVLKTETARIGLQMFIDWLRSFQEPITLAGYNNHK